MDVSSLRTGSQRTDEVESMITQRSKFRTDAKESDIQKLILDWLAAEKIFHLRLNTGSFAMPASGNQKRRFFRAGRKGMADIMAVRFNCICGKNGCKENPHTETYWLEVKAAKGVQSDDQKIFQIEVESHGMRYILARSLDEVIEGMK